MTERVFAGEMIEQKACQKACGADYWAMIRDTLAAVKQLASEHELIDIGQVGGDLWAHSKDYGSLVVMNGSLEQRITLGARRGTFTN